MKTVQIKVAGFFESHPEATEVHEALGVLFTDKEKANTYLAGVAGRMVTTHTREGVNYERESDRIRHEVLLQENVVSEKHLAYENSPVMEKEQAMSEWKKEEGKLAELNNRLGKQVELESKEERISRENKKPSTDDLKKPELTKEEFGAAISAQQAIVDGNEKLIAVSKGKKKEKAEKVQQDEIVRLEKMKTEFAEKFPAEDGTGSNAGSDATTGSGDNE
ncbi:MAG: hypothetical protein ACT4OJ_08780 [Bacteroidota bacterium]